MLILQNANLGHMGVMSYPVRDLCSLSVLVFNVRLSVISVQRASKVFFFALYRVLSL